MRRGAALGVLVTLLLTGCGRKLYPVEGTVQWADGKPALELVGGAVNFNADDGSVSATGAIGAEGRYRLGTLRPDDGVPAGDYKVVLSPPPTGDPDKPSRPVLKPDYQRLDSTPLKAKVEAKGNNIPLKVERPAR